MSTTGRSQSSAGFAPRQASAQVLLNRYRVLQTNTQGGFGRVSICWDARLQRRVAIKCMPLLSNADAAVEVSTIEEALTEARTSSMLAHPNIVTMYDFECDDVYSYLVMEYVDGLNLAELLSRVEDGVLTFDECAHVVRSVARALDYAHENGVLHLDIKPANILIDRTGTVKLSDFGMATLASAAGFGGARGGTIGYMPPEQIEGDYVDERCDLFSLAVVAWQSMAGFCPFAAESADESLRLICKRPPSLTRLEPELAPEAEDILERALDPDPRVRMSSVADFSEELCSVLGDVHEGRESLADLITQTGEDSELRPIKDWERLRVPLAARFPWLPGAATRLLSAACSGWVASLTIPVMFAGSAEACAFGVAGVCAATACWPPLAGVFGVIGIAAAVFSQTAQASIILGICILAAGLTWWGLIGRSYDLSGPSLMLAGCIWSPFAHVAIASFGLPPLAALVTGAMGWLYWLLLTSAEKVLFAPDALQQTLRGAFSNVDTWVTAATCAIATCVASICTRRATMWAIAAGQLLSILILAGVPALLAHMENTSIADALDKPALAVALVLGVTLCLVCALAGAEGLYREGDDTA